MPGPPGWLARRPLTAVAIALIVGIGVADALPHRAWLWLGLAALALAGGVWNRRPIVATGLMLVAALLAGILVAQLDRQYYPAVHLAHFAADQRRLAGVEMDIGEAPRVVQIDFGQRHALPPKQAFVGDVTAVRTWSGWRPASGRVLVQGSEVHPALAAGQRVRISGTLDRPAPAMNPGQFDWAEYYRRQRVLVSLHVPHARNITILDRGPPSWHVRWVGWTREKLAAGFLGVHSLDHALLRALVLGDPDPELRDVQEAFRATGTSHHLAISGMHIAVMGGCVFFLMRLLRTTPRTAWLAAMAFVLLYGAAALPSPPVVRAVLTWLAIGVAVLSRRPVDFLHLLSLIVIAMLVYQPADLFNAGFQLSFGTVLGLSGVAGPMAKFLGGKNEADAFESPPKEWMFRLARRIDSQIILVLAAGVTAWLVSMPLIATHFSQLNPWAVFAGIALAPIVFVALIGGLLKIVMTAVWPGLADTWADLARLPIAMMRHGVEWLATFPFGDVPLPAPPGWVVALFYVTMLLAAFNTRTAGLRLLSRLAFLAALLALLALPYRTAIAAQASPDKLRLTLLSVGAGQCVVIEPPGGRTTLIDAGSLSLADPVRRCVGPFLRARGITNIDTVFVTHADTDHYGAVGDLVDAYAVREVLAAEPFEAAVARNFVGQAFLKTLRDANRPPRRIAPGQAIPLGTDTTVDVLWPPADRRGLSTNDQSLVLRLTHAGRRVLFTGDIQAVAMTELLETPDVLKADVLIAPHHGSSESTTARFLKAVGADVVLSSNDRSLTRKQAVFDMLAGPTPVLRTSAVGAVLLSIDGTGKLTVDTQLPRRP
ncbi:MAG TPA: ComEC/Rec2 family competence protein [Tepidisphaeraceae bacterium]